FWRTVAVKSSNDVTRLQALVDKKKVVVTEAAIRDALHLDNVEGVDCLRNEEIFTELACMGYEKPTTKLTFYKAFFSSQWKFLIHTILQSMSAKHTTWNEFSSAMAFAVICLSTGSKFNFSKYIFESLVRNVDSSTKFYMYPRVGKGCSGVETPLLEGMLVVSEPEEQGNVEEHGNEEEQGNADTTAEEPETARVDTSDDTLMEDVSNQGRVFDRDEDDVKETEEVREYTADTQSKLLFLLPNEKRGVVIWDPKEESSTKTPTETTYKDKGKGMSYDDIRPIFEAKFNANMEFLLKSKEQIEEEESRAIAIINETPARKVAKRIKLIKEAKEAESIKQHLQIVPD
nr:glutamic acid-rich protein-like [Tanacetum cinerariifolium]